MTIYCASPVVAHVKRFFIFFKDFIYLFLDRGEGWEKERERNINVWLPLTHPLLGAWPATQACALGSPLGIDPATLRFTARAQSL